MKVSVIVPARLQSSRFPQKILQNLGGVPILRRVLERLRRLQTVDEIVALVDDGKVLQLVSQWGFRGILTPTDCASGTERIVFSREKLAGDFILNVQGDEPFISLSLLGEMISVAKNFDGDALTAIYPIASAEALLNPNRVKVVLDARDRAIYFSRHPIPFLRDISERERWPTHHQFWGHIGVYGYSRKILSQYPSLGEGILEKAERLEQLRLLENGISIQCIRTDEAALGIDTPEDLVAAEEFLQLHPEF
ncbi:MAG: 3-deoxy-manno-octulosonate cytidylyltransferase [Puniceicoccales bacterium]|jgi:3-deoxy-manno-octulosonate cytidylyltransferase (CMP-KDO synthetase)|nr:3-deoxy-manno-octulosonate cytidylyltransferase [Puniceicoccales bacterium]